MTTQIRNSIVEDFIKACVTGFETGFLRPVLRIVYGSTPSMSGGSIVDVCLSIVGAKRGLFEKLCVQHSSTLRALLAWGASNGIEIFGA